MPFMLIPAFFFLSAGAYSSVIRFTMTGSTTLCIVAWLMLALLVYFVWARVNRLLAVVVLLLAVPVGAFLSEYLNRLVFNNSSAMGTRPTWLADFVTIFAHIIDFSQFAFWSIGLLINFRFGVITVRLFDDFAYELRPETKSRAAMNILLAAVIAGTLSAYVAWVGINLVARNFFFDYIGPPIWFVNTAWIPAIAIAGIIVCLLPTAARLAALYAYAKTEEWADPFERVN